MLQSDNHALIDAHESWSAMIEDLRLTPELAGGGQPTEIVQTHISVVLLGRDYALKLKKPLNFGFLDYTTVEKRRRACLAEVELNSRLSRDVYCGVQAITLNGGKYCLGGDGEIVDYVVVMRRLPQERMLDALLTSGEVTETMLNGIAERLAVFHRHARRDRRINQYGGSEIVRYNWRENLSQAEPYIDRTIDSRHFDSIRNWVHEWLEKHEPLLKRRVVAGRICEGHGDVRCESICLPGDASFDDIVIFDCIEFSERFRCGDVASEVAFLAMDLHARGRPDLGYRFTEQYAAYARDDGLFPMLSFYRCYRAFVRGKVLSFQLNEPEIGAAEREQAAIQARHYFDLALRYATPLAAPSLVVVSGLSGTGKTTVAQAIAGELGLRVVSSDEIRHEVFGVAKKTTGYAEGSYGEAADRLIYHLLFKQGLAQLQQLGGVVLDATFRREANRRAAHELAKSAGAQFFHIECQLASGEVKPRIERRIQQRESLSEATWQTYLRQREEYEPVGECADGALLSLDTSLDIDSCGQAATDWLRNSSRR